MLLSVKTENVLHKPRSIPNRKYLALCEQKLLLRVYGVSDGFGNSV